MLTDIGTVTATTAVPVSVSTRRTRLLANPWRVNVRSRMRLSKDGKIVDLNRLISHRSHMKLQVASNINNRGEIAHRGTANGDQHAFLLVPCNGEHPGIEDPNYR